MKLKKIYLIIAQLIRIDEEKRWKLYCYSLNLAHLGLD